jgi:hypothetical protein
MRRISTATKVTDKFGVGKHGFTDGNSVTGIPATDLEGQFFDHVQEELAGIVEATGGAVDGSSRTQVLNSINALIEARVGDYVLDTGVANAYVIALNPVIAAYTGTFEARFKAVNANTGACTVNAGGGVVPLVREDGQPMQAGDIPAGGLVSFTYDPVGAKAIMVSVVPSQMVATQAETDAGTIDNKFITPKKLRWGFSASLTPNGYVIFPSWLGGFIIQWGAASVTTSTGVAFPITFPNAIYTLIANQGMNGVANNATVDTFSQALTGFTASAFVASTGAAVTRTVSFISIGR